MLLNIRQPVHPLLQTVFFSLLKSSILDILNEKFVSVQYKKEYQSTCSNSFSTWRVCFNDLFGTEKMNCKATE